MSAATALDPVVQETHERASGLWADAWRRLRRNRAAVVAAVILLVLSVLAIFAPWIPGLQDPTAQNLALGATGPSGAHWFGTDELGRDTFVRTIYGGRISLLVGLIGTLVSLLIGVTYGAVSGYMGGKIDEAMMRFVDILYSLPTLMLIIVLMALFERSFLLLLVALAVVGWLDIARIVRGQALTIRAQEYIDAARALGVRTPAMIWRHVLPNLIGLVAVYATLTIPGVILFEALLSFLGLGVHAPLASLGSLVAEGANEMQANPYLLIFPAAFLAVIILCLNRLGDALRDALDLRQDGNRG